MTVANVTQRKAVLSTVNVFAVRLTTGKNLVLISPTTFEKFEIEDFVLSIHPQIGIKFFFKNYFYTYFGMN